MHALALQLGHVFNLTYFNQLLGKLQQHFPAAIRMDNGSASELNIGLYLVSFLQESLGMLEFEIEIVLIGIGTEPDFFDFHLLLFGLVFLFTLAFFIAKLGILHDLDNGRRDIAIDFNEVCF